MTLNCYRLAREYKVSPEIFLNMPLSQIARHMEWTVRLIERINQEREWESRG